MTRKQPEPPATPQPSPTGVCKSRTTYAGTSVEFICPHPGVYDPRTGFYFCRELHLSLPYSFRKELVSGYATTVVNIDGTPHVAAPRVEGAVDRLWAIFDEMSGRPRAEVLKRCIDLEHFKPNTAKTQYYYWKTGRVHGKKPGAVKLTKRPRGGRRGR